MSRIIVFKIGHLPVRCLKVPLVSRKLSIKDYEVLVSRIKLRINGWASKMLSFAVRLQVIQAVLYSIQIFWCQHFIFPKAVLKLIIKLCTDFLCKENSEKTAEARVSWSFLSHPKVGSGLGLGDLDAWNKACILKCLWNIHRRAELVWVV